MFHLKDLENGSMVYVMQTSDVTFAVLHVVVVCKRPRNTGVAISGPFKLI
jgi:hypothetical protein